MNLLEKYRKNKDVIIMSHKGLNLIKYKNLGVDWNNELTRDARGLILDDNGNIVARPFEKFFNLGELDSRNTNGEYDDILHLSRHIEDMPYEVTNKLDGSLVIAFYYDGKVKFASSGSLTSDHAKIFKEFYDAEYSDEDKAIFKDVLKSGKTIMLEYTAPSNRIVVAYEKPEMSIIGVNYNDKKLGDLSLAEIKELFKDTSFKTTEEIDVPMSDLKDYINSKTNFEGVVIRYENGMRIKMKGDEYLSLHKARSGLDLFYPENPANKELVAELLLSGEEGDLDDMMSTLNKSFDKEAIDTLNKFRDEVIERLENYKTFADDPKPAVDFYKSIPKRDRYKIDKDIIVHEYDNGVRVSFGLAEQFYRGYNSMLNDSREVANILKETRRNKRAKMTKALLDIYGPAANHTVGLSISTYAHRYFDIKEFILDTLDKDSDVL